MTFEEIVEREDCNVNRIFLHKEGSFYKAYNQSAFLFHTKVSSFKIKVRFISSINRKVISLAFPVGSLKKWMHGYPCEELSPTLLCYDVGKSISEVEYYNWAELVEVEYNTTPQYTIYTSVIENQPVYKTAYDALFHICQFSKHVDKNYREPYANKAKTLSYDICYSLRLLYEVPDRDSMINSIQSFCKELLFVLQVLKDCRQISLNTYALCSEKIMSVSNQLNGLRRTVTA